MSSSVSHKERAERYYAYNLEKAKERGNKIKKAFNFDNIKKGFYDELISFDEKLKKDKMELESKKINGFKELVYTNVKVPDVWRNKLTYQSDLYNTMNDDDFFVSYLGKGGNNMNIETEKKNQKNETVNSILNNSNKKSSTSYNTSFQQIKEKPKIKFNFNNSNKKIIKNHFSASHNVIHIQSFSNINYHKNNKNKSNPKTNLINNNNDKKQKYESNKLIKKQFSKTTNNLGLYLNNNNLYNKDSYKNLYCKTRIKSNQIIKFNQNQVVLIIFYHQELQVQ